MQFSNFEPAVRHSIVAISSLYEQFQAGAAPCVEIKDNSLALQHYNAAIRELKNTENQPLVLLVCILFICIEFLQSNKAAAIQHCKHGIALLENVNYAWAREHLVPVFRRLSIFPFFFGNGHHDFPDLVPLDDHILGPFSTFADAQSAMDSILSQTLRLVRWGDAYRFGSSRYEEPSSELLAEREETRSQLDQWHVLIKDLDAKLTMQVTPVMENYNLGEDFIQAMSRAILSVRYEVCRIWLDIAFDADETCYDWHLDGFRRVIQSCLFVDSTIPSTSRMPAVNRNPKFIFETGFMPLLHFVATKCRDFNVRLEALRLMKILGVPRENLWEVDQMFALGRRVIEIEHGVILNDLGQPTTPPSCPGLPSDEKRVRFTLTEPKATVHVDENGEEVRGWKVDFVMRSSQDDIYIQNEFIVVERPGIGGNEHLPHSSPVSTCI